MAKRKNTAYVGGYVPAKVADALRKLASKRTEELGIHVSQSDLISKFLQDGVKRELGVTHPEVTN
jgi:hypothetical protein